VLYDLRQAEPAMPILYLLELKLQDFQYMITQKRQIKDHDLADNVSSSTAA
jgi:hypothetical protein